MDNFWHKKDKKFNKNVSVRDLLLGKKNFFREIYFQPCGYSKRNSLETCLGSKDRSKLAAERIAEYKEYFTNQGYPSKLVSDQFSKASAIPRNDLLRTRGKETEKLFPFVITFNPNLPDVGNIIRKHLFILQFSWTNFLSLSLSLSL